MPSITLLTLTGAYDVSEYGIDNTGNRDAATLINRLLSQIANETSYGIVLVRPGIYRIDTPIQMQSNIELVGWGRATTFRLYDSKNDDVFVCNGVSNIRIKDIRIDGNRANNTSGTRQGLWLNNVTDAWIENVDVVSCRTDGFRLDNCTRVEVRGGKASDNGRHGFSLSNSQFCQLVSPRSYDNCQVSSVGVGDGINLALLSSDNTIICPVCYETALVGDRQGYGVREAAGEGCARNVVIGTGLRGNRTGAISLDSGDSVAITPQLIQLPMGVVITA